MIKTGIPEQITKGREQLEEARRTYEILNTELHDELPALHDSRILFLVTNLQTLFASEQVFHSETSKVGLPLPMRPQIIPDMLKYLFISAQLFAELEAVVDKLASDSQRGSYTLKKINGKCRLVRDYLVPSHLMSVYSVPASRQSEQSAALAQPTDQQQHRTEQQRTADQRQRQRQRVAHGPLS